MKKNNFVHFLTNVPNSSEGWDFIRQLKKHLNTDRYKIRIKGRGSRKKHGNQCYVPLPHSEHYSIYVDQKIIDFHNPSFYTKENWEMRNNLREIKNKINAILGDE